ncbi:hypothetical protein [Arthrobacter sp. ZGTC212]|uniref:hypothetical protein n=1 Tax=Arthrobacter sp. ZGTC212 TaxID=2058899 RepID=UPI000CE552B1|nr:hypothetical protein [Arthrobacter sp. ZGTC212]
MGTQPNDPMPGYGQGYPPPPEPANDGRGLGLAGLILGVIALVLFWLPLLNYVSLVLALVGLGLSIASLVIVRRRGTPQGMSVAAVIVSSVALLAAILATVFWSALFNSVDEELDNPLTPVTVTPTTTATVTQTAAPTATADPTIPTTGNPPGAATAVPNREILPLGTAAEVGDYTVTVSDVELDATDSILGVSEFNDPPDGQYVLITLDVVYNGTEEGDPWIDLATRFVGSDSRQYSPSTCLAILDLPATDVPTLENGGSGQYEVCMDVPAAAIPGQRVFVEDNTSFDGSEASWQTQ